ncbi:type III polyketide synthase [Actinoalloteichus hymeniacidonis]|uniref:Isopalmitoylresorcinol synthase n=1 Tax=Actinoalloteichus hymeniacidonis TaxID=340345 RepID=A0AAC9MYY7_9PSEU|nr:3-oxoacyl-[acyl-carrier-protein] synthase III C-terminal domain-containing protein [Actinoalloteichus hymeniacidonis]AOS63497.1 isopalmitoylresorcinol synthase [Actinoalloteichus hymeniacidonis]MBB5908459.1 alkylresorcinol/alkylpyrone synthase [Actinoalloteichus hymeniacidonis]
MSQRRENSAGHHGAATREATRWPGSGARVASSAMAFPEHVYRQEEISAAFVEEILSPGDSRRRAAQRISGNSGVRTRHFAVPIERLRRLADFTEANEAYLASALELGEQAVRRALAVAGIAPEEVDLVVSTTVTGLAVPSLEARLAQRLGLREDVKRIPMFGLGCVAGAAGIARVHDYLLAWPDQVAILLSVELCSLTLQRGDASAANIVGSSLFGDGAAAVVLTGSACEIEHPGPTVIATRSRLYPDSEAVMGWDIGADGFRLVLSTDVPAIAREFLSKDVVAFLSDHGLTTGDIAHWICHPGGPKVIEAVRDSLDLAPDALRHTVASLAANGNLSSASVLDVLRRTIAEAPAPGSFAVLLAMGPGFCSELVLLRW